MRDLDRALADIAAIRTQVARGSEFRGYGPMTVTANQKRVAAFSAVLATEFHFTPLSRKASPITVPLMTVPPEGNTAVVGLSDQIDSRLRRTRTATARSAAATPNPTHTPGLMRYLPGVSCER